MSTKIKHNGEWKNTKTLVKNNLSGWLPPDLYKSLDWANYLNTPVNAGTTAYVTLTPDKVYFVIIQLSTNFEGWIDKDSATPRTKLLVIKNNNIIMESSYTSSWFTYTVANNRVTVTTNSSTNCVNLTAIPVNYEHLSWEILPSHSVFAALNYQQSCSRNLDHNKIYYIESTLCLTREQQQATGNKLRTEGFIFEKGTLTRVSTASHGVWTTTTVSNDTVTIKNNQPGGSIVQRCTVAIIDITDLIKQIATEIKIQENWWRSK